MLRRFRRDRRGASEIVGTALFLVILFFFFTNVFLWHDQVTREMDQVVVDRMNSAVRLENATAIVDGSSGVLRVLSVGGLGVTLSRLWIVTDDYHWFADFEDFSVYVAAGGYVDITLSGNLVKVGENEVQVRVYANGSVFVDYAPELPVTFRVLTKRANSAARGFE